MAKQPSANPTYKLIYFELEALGESIRILFNYGGIKFEDCRIPTPKWPEYKPKTPMGQLPILEIDGIEVYQSKAIGRYLAKLVGLAGKNDWENLLIDIAVDNVNDICSKISTAFLEADEVAKQQKLEQIKKETLPFYLDKLDATAKENNGYLALGRLTWADVLWFGIQNFLNYMLDMTVTTDNHPNLKRVLTNVSNVEPIKAYISQRPKTKF